GRDLGADSAIARFLALPGFAALQAEHDKNRAPLTRGSVVASFPDSTFWPEGTDYDSTTGRYYLASVRHRTVAAWRPGGAVRELWPRDRHEFGAILGVRADPRRQRIWATTSGLPQMQGYVAADSSIAALLEVNVETGKLERRWDLPPVPGGHVLGDLAIGP